MNESRRKLADFQIGVLVKKLEEVKKRIENHSLSYQSTICELNLLTEGNAWIIPAAIKNGLEPIRSSDALFSEVPTKDIVDEQMLIHQIFLVYQKIRDLLERHALNYDEIIHALQGIIENQGHLMRRVVSGSARIIHNIERVNFQHCPADIKGFQLGFNNFKDPTVFNLRDYKLLKPEGLKNGFSSYFCSLREKSPNVNLFYFLLDNRNLIPKDWSKRYVCSLGTIYWDEIDDNSYIPVFVHEDGVPRLELVPLDSDFDENFDFLAYADVTVNGFKKG
ncbi:hypothetical protein EOL72_01065 [Candidatus Falkowbacteria bacterium]|jgi:hypothetical protein|nr:hypothetical protein [Patescibacteria group bacterium]MDD3434983.1 hypothetical protein [Patescibacteria group bacterium]MDD4466353.1 hypothetical protein [Patescibacteria group bacterium]NCU42930.1 hypothetical protein [Candidatus Falkowbacteria bacterium]